MTIMRKICSALAVLSCFQICLIVVFRLTKVTDRHLIVSSKNNVNAKQEINYTLLKNCKLVEEYQLYHNICVIENNAYDISFTPFVATLNSYDSNRATKSSKFPINLDKEKHDSFWIVQNYNSSVPDEYQMKNEIAFFPEYLRDFMNVFNLWHDTLPSALAQLKFADKNILTRPVLDKQYSNKTKLMSKNASHESKSVAFKKRIITTSLVTISQSFQDTIKSLGYEYLVDYQSQRSQSPICYRFGIIGETESLSRPRPEVRNTVKSMWEKDKSACKEYYVLLLQRKGTRRILDIDFIVQLLKKEGFKNIRIEFFEGVTLVDQYDIIRCTALLIGK